MVKLNRLCFAAGLTVRQAEVILYMFGEGMSQQEIAEELDINISSVRDRINGALKKLRKWAEKNDLDADGLRFYGIN